MTTKSPFYVIQDFLSPLLCEEMIYNLDMCVPDTDKEGHPIRTVKHNETLQEIIFDRMSQNILELENHYGVTYAGTEQMLFEWYPQGCSGESVHCENSNYIKGKWLKTKNRDFSGIIFLSDYRDKIPFDNDFEVYGGKLEFPQHGFGFNPARGTLILFPSVPHFINATTQIQFGDLYQVRFHIATRTPFLYDPKQFPGNFYSWFQQFS